MKKQRIVPALSLASVLLLVSPAQAGFEWKGALVPEAAAPTAPATDMSGLEPVISWDGTTQQMPAQKVEGVEAADIAAAATSPQPLTPAEMTTAPAAEIVSGFGMDLPLAIALQQVVPAGYQFSFATDVDPGMNVSWQGGQGWERVLSDMLSRQGLGYRLQKNTVLIARAEAVTPAATKPVTIRRQKPTFILRNPFTGSSNVPAAPATAAPAAAGKADQPAMTGEAVPVEMTPVPESTYAPVSLAPAAGASSGGNVMQAPTTTPSPWSAARGETLRDVLKKWSDAAGVELYWSIDYDYRVTQDVNVAGTYDEAVGRVLDMFSASRPQPFGQLHQGGDGPRVLVVKSYDLAQ